MSFTNLFRIIPEPFGLDISDSSFKVAKLLRRNRDFDLKSFGSQDIEKGVLDDGVILDEDKLANLIKEGLKKTKNWSSDPGHVACSLPEQKTYLRIIQLPKINRDDIKDALQWEIEANIPISVDDAYYDWEVISGSDGKRAEGQDRIDVLVSVSPKDIVDSYTRTLEKAGLKVYSFEPESVALARSLIRKGFSKEPVLIIDFGQTRTSFIIYAGSALRFATSVKVSGDAVTDMIVREMGVGKQEAEKLKLEIGLDKEKDPKVFEAIVSIMTDLKEQADQYIDFYQEHSSYATGGKEGVSKILLAGGGASLKGIEKYLALTLNTPVELGNPWVNIMGDDLKRIPEMAFEDSLRYCTVFGLALNARASFPYGQGVSY